jgi:hypothetical protein
MALDGMLNELNVAKVSGLGVRVGVVPCVQENDWYGVVMVRALAEGAAMAAANTTMPTTNFGFIGKAKQIMSQT